MAHRLVAILILACAPLTARAITAQTATTSVSAEQTAHSFASGESEFIACDEIIVSDVAFEMAKTAVAEKLWSPTSAQFPLVASRISKTATCGYIIRSWVEARNGFGQMVRTPYVVEMENKTGDWAVLGARLGSPSYARHLELASID